MDKAIMVVSMHKFPPHGIETQQFLPSKLSNIAPASISNLQTGKAVPQKPVSGAASATLELTGLDIWDSIEYSSSKTFLMPEALENSDTAGQPHVFRQKHSKSRRGCYNCKKRRIKCEENHPACTQCTKRKLQCKWPEIQFRHARAVLKENSTPAVPAQLKSSHAAFSMQDFRLFYHYIQKAHPVNNVSIWTHEIPSISHNYDFLMHAMLGYSASDLSSSLTRDSDLAYSAISHRTLAIKALNLAMCNGLHTFEQGNAMLATCYILLLQSAFIEDGFYEMLSFLRGCVLITRDMEGMGLRFLFNSILGLDVLSKIDPQRLGTLKAKSDVVDAAHKSLDALSPLCQQDYQKKFQQTLLKLADIFYISSQKAFLYLTEIYITIMDMSHQEFQNFINPTNEVGQVLQFHFMSLHFLLYPVAEDDEGEIIWKQFVTDTANEFTKWLGPTHRRLSPQMLAYCGWPVSVHAVLKKVSFSLMAEDSRESIG